MRNKGADFEKLRAQSAYDHTKKYALLLVSTGLNGYIITIEKTPVILQLIASDIAMDKLANQPQSYNSARQEVKKVGQVHRTFGE